MNVRSIGIAGRHAVAGAPPEVRRRRPRPVKCDNRHRHVCATTTRGIREEPAFWMLMGGSREKPALGRGTYLRYSRRNVTRIATAPIDYDSLRLRAKESALPHVGHRPLYYTTIEIRRRRLRLLRRIDILRYLSP